MDIRTVATQGAPALRLLALLTIYATVTAVAYWLAYELRFDFEPEHRFMVQIQAHWHWVVLFKVGVLAAFGQFSGLLSYFSIPDLRRLLFANVVASGLMLAVRITNSDVYSVPRGVIMMDFLLTFAGLSLLRLGFRVVRERYFSPVGRTHKGRKRVGIIGAGDVGASLAKELFAKRGLGLRPVVFFDDDKSKWNLRVHDVPVIGAPESLLKRELNLQLDEAIIALPSASPKRIGEIVRILHQAHIPFETVPSLDQLATGQVKVSNLRNVEIEDLLGREPVTLDTDNIRQVLKERVVMVTGAGGSIGSELCRQIATFGPQRLLLVEQSEVQIFQIEQELIEKGFGGIAHPLVADVLDEARMRHIFGRFQPAVVFHAAAHKHVPMMESQPSEAIKNNTLTTALLSRLALEYNVDRFVLISTDKAINPTNVMGATKRMAELYLQSFAAANMDRTKFIAVRFGNVLGSSGSVIPVFKKQIAAGGPVKVTHPEVTRYFMTIPEAAGLVLQSGAQGEGGEIFVLDMGSPVKIVDLARELIVLSGFTPDEDIMIEFTGLRPGEKLYEELSHHRENTAPTAHPKIVKFVSEALPLQEIESHIATLTAELHHSEPEQLKLLIQKMVPEYKPYLT